MLFFVFVVLFTFVLFCLHICELFVYRSPPFSNAVKFTGKGKQVEVRVTRKVSATRQNLVLISCKDHGAGLSKANLKLLFGEGVQVKTNRLQNGGGSGLGLFIAKGIVTLHEGAKIWAESEGEGQGCTFCVELPLVTISPSFECEADNEGDESISSSLLVSLGRCIKGSDVVRQPVAVSLPPDLSLDVLPFRPRVLIVDDSLMNRRMMSRMLEAEGFDCHHAVDGLAAVAVVNRAVMMPNNSSRKSHGPLSARRGTTPGAHATAGLRNTGYYRKGSNGGDRREKSLRSTGSNGSGSGVPTDVILMDSNMPKMNGPDAIVEIRKLGFKFPIFGITGDANHTSFLRAGADGVMMKPVKADELVKVIRTALRQAVDHAAEGKAAMQTAAGPEAVGLLAPRLISAAAPVDDEHLASLQEWLTS